MRRATRPAIVIALLGVACRDEVELRTGLDQPLRVATGFFLEGELPVADDGPTVTAIEVTNAVALIGQDDRGLGGRTSDDTWAIGLRFATLGSGWWVNEVGDISALFPGERDFGLSYALGGGIPEGLHTLHVAAIDERGRRGQAIDLELCVLDDAVPVGLGPCDPSVAPPAMIVGLAWNRDVDLDLILEGPSGKRISWKSPTSGTPTNGVVPDEMFDDPTLGRLNRDSNAGCITDGRNSEAVVFHELPEDGPWSAYVDLFDPCGEVDVTFTVAVYERRERNDGTFRVDEVQRRGGTIVPQFEAYGESNEPLYVLTAALP